MPQTVAPPTVPEVVALVNRLGRLLERIDRDQTKAVELCEQIAEAAENVVGDSSWGLVATEAGCVREVLPGGGSEGDPLYAFGLVRDLVELAVRRSEQVNP
jgi:hypothetical protein